MLRRCFLARIVPTLPLWALATLTPSLAAAGRLELRPEIRRRIGRRIWENECGGTVSGLTSWNQGEDFPSLGIGHFIWYPQGTPRTFEESFPGLLRHFEKCGVRLPSWLRGDPPCPWPDRQAFQRELDGPRLRELRTLLSKTVDAQTDYIVLRLEAALPRILAAAPRGEKKNLETRFYAVAGSPNGLYALIDYVNFKGEGVNPRERYRGQGWGLLQVLQGMRGQPSGQAAVVEFSDAAKRALERRIRNAPRDESRWRQGWFNRCETYKRSL
ncbi:MAG TPA: hypothetical protein VMN36_00045 [Verrucomicrobiales bacterium]|nr:hypothetical protein [Verrucomicrobiales bacterium]